MTINNALNVVSIDPPGAKEIDDAIFARATATGWEVEVCIPDVPSILKLATSEDDEARSRGLTTYAANAIRQPMLPPDMVERLSLSPDNDRPMIQVTLEVSPDLRAKVKSIKRIVGRTRAKLSYQEADLILANEQHELHAMLATLWDLTARLQQERSAATGAVFDLERGIITDEEGRQIKVDKDQAHKSNLVVMEIMVLTNSALAAYAAENGHKVLYRNHVLEGYRRGDRQSCAEELALKERMGRTVARQKLKTLGHLVRQAELSTTNLGHFGLDACFYGWFTSPLRRYVDVVNLRAIVENADEKDIEALASRYTGLYRQQREDSSDHHARMRRKDIAAWISARTNRPKLDAYDVHTIIRALSENPSYHKIEAGAYIRTRLLRDDLSGRDIEQLLLNADNLFNADVANQIKEWANAPARQALLEAYRQGVVQPVSEPSSKINHKGRLLELAAQMKATIEFHPAERSGPSHASVFVSRATWKRQGAKIEDVAQARTIKNAEQAVAEKILMKIEQTTNGERPAVQEPQNEKSPKNVLLELVQKTPGASLVFEEPVKTGPEHAPNFSVNAIMYYQNSRLLGSGEGSSKREAERKASMVILDQIDAPVSK